ncbi:MAG: hypothetical protein JJT76_13425 [Clostridiaceae bacterium]|nr:hypothetical protein [Clostridiaceae bacterium]
MLTIKCAKCKIKLLKYQKIGSGKVLKCHKSRIKRIYKLEKDLEDYRCKCGNFIGKDEGSFIKMHEQGFIYTGTKE